MYGGSSSEIVTSVLDITEVTHSQSEKRVAGGAERVMPSAIATDDGKIETIFAVSLSAVRSVQTRYSFPAFGKMSSSRMAEAT